MADNATLTEKKSRKNSNIDGGYAWFILTGCFVVYTFLVGSIKSYGILYTEMVDYYSSGYGKTAWIGGIASLLRLTLGPVANLLSRKYSFRIVTFFGGLLLGLGYIMSGFVSQMEFMYLTFTCCGLGYGFTFSPCTTIVSFYFDKRRALANGITVSGSGIGSLVLPFLYKFLIEKYGLKGTFWITGAIFCNICVAACIFRQPKVLKEDTLQRQQECGSDSKLNCDEHQASQTRTRACTGIDLKLSLFKNPVFTMYAISFALCIFSYTGNITLIPANVKALGYSKDLEALCVTIAGGVESVARILIGWFADMKKIRPKYIYVISMLIAGVFSMLAPLFDSFTFMAIYSAVIALFPSSLFSLLSLMIIDVVGMEQFPAAFGLISFCMAFGSTSCQPVLGWMKDYFGNWHPSFMLSGAVFILAGLIVLTEPIIARYIKKQKPTDDD